MSRLRSIGKFGAWTITQDWPDDPGEVGEAAAEVERLGFAASWIGGSTGQLPVLDAILEATSTLVGVTGVSQVWVNTTAEIAKSHHQLTSKYPGRFLLGLGVGHAWNVEAAGHKYERPLGKLSAFLDDLDTGERPVPVGERVIAALGPKALALATTRAAGAHPYNVTPEHTARARAAMGSSALLFPEQKVVVESDPSEACRGGPSDDVWLPRQYAQRRRELPPARIRRR
ncbi:MAG TPA: LLM class flavin-dependent oxidoreductase [Acidimicrobiales bacterium]|jgi:probable F420-dependent oxidoreductase|nr:LLM class flavin-dependent oxidoreductase [Acidimicrobiales bacterium]